MKDTGHVKVDEDGKEMIDIAWKHGSDAKGAIREGIPMFINTPSEGTLRSRLMSNLNDRHIPFTSLQKDKL